MSGSLFVNLPVWHSSYPQLSLPRCVISVGRSHSCSWPISLRLRFPMVHNLPKSKTYCQFRPSNFSRGKLQVRKLSISVD